MEKKEDNSDPNPDNRFDPDPIKKLDIHTIRELWSKTYNAEGKPDWSHLFPYYHPDIVFQDTIGRIEGIQEFKALCGRLTRALR